MKAAGFSVAGAMLASCARAPVEKVIPLLFKPENATPGKPNWYATTCAGCGSGCGLLAKIHDGRPIKVEGNPEHPVSAGGVCAVGQASVISLYDSRRLQKPLLKGHDLDWAKVDEWIRGELAEITGSVYFLTGTVASPTTRALIQEFLGRFERSGHVEYDAVSYSAILDAHLDTCNARVLPHYRFDRAKVIVSFDADFLGTWLSPVEFTKAYVAGRTLEGETPRLSKHIQFEGRLSLTGSNADLRVKVTPDECRAAIWRLGESLARKAGVPFTPEGVSSPKSGLTDETLDALTNDLWSAKGDSLVVCGMNDVSCQRMVNFINHVLGNYGRTLDIEKPSLQWNGSDRAVRDLVQKMRAGEVQALFIADVNPVYSLPDAREFVAALEKAPLVVTFAEQLHETAQRSGCVCPVHHFLESWNDAEVVAGVLGVSQPAMRPMGETRTVRECLSAWLGTPRGDLEIIQSHWRHSLFTRQDREASFEAFWDHTVRDGFATVNANTVRVTPFRFAFAEPNRIEGSLSPDAIALVLYEKISMRDGRHAHNPWLQELPDPVTKAVWDNYVCIAPALAKKLRIEQGDVVEVQIGQATVELPALVQPGQHDKVLAIALGYGRAGTDRFSQIGPQWIQSELTVRPGATVGKNAFALCKSTATTLLLENTVSIRSTGKTATIATTQTHHTIEDPDLLGGHRRDVVRETTLEAFVRDPASGNRYEHEVVQLWQNDHEYKGHRWGMSIDLNRCTGCSACVIACQSENNVPVVGKDEVSRHREMQWIRIDRYYSGDETHVGVLHQPVMCQHCDHAPCETVCPVLATTHSDEGLNQQVYNRCIGTRYCANNCPYKVRRFNWFEYRRERKREDLVLNPDVTVRSRGVMEKCSLCVQRIQEAKAEATRLGQPLADGDIQVACQQSCPGSAIVFGDLNDPSSRVSKLNSNPRHYHVLEEMGFKPAVGYLTKVRNGTLPS
ncbi:MAG: 4Fe-4S dicluster domain-containing protein [Planctomycetes bacterium]|nr:4Fe-4S dicluster domain-containing protein [Planctomycetota bacterium]